MNASKATNHAGYAVFIYLDDTGWHIDSEPKATYMEALRLLDQTPQDGFFRTVREAIWHKGVIA